MVADSRDPSTGLRKTFLSVGIEHRRVFVEVLRPSLGRGNPLQLRGHVQPDEAREIARQLVTMADALEGKKDG